ncbi:MAG: hypothetical protein JSS66_17570 [Armatimonadetes bacterium]|nr:hypothetical protein [Armatimonadota bacterium]
MAERSFRLGYCWELEGTIDAAFYYISHIATWPTWWPQIVAVQTDDPEKHEVAVGDTALMKARSFLPYGLDWQTEVTRIEPPHLIEVASAVELGKSFELAGTVAFELTQKGGRVLAVNRQEMSPKRPVAGVLWPVMNAIFNFNHDYAMKRGQAGLQRVLDQVKGASLTI